MPIDEFGLLVVDVGYQVLGVDGLVFIQTYPRFGRQYFLNVGIYFGLTYATFGNGFFDFGNGRWHVGTELQNVHARFQAFGIACTIGKIFNQPLHIHGIGIYQAVKFELIAK